MEAMVDQESCIGCGLCCGTCEDVFRMNDDGKAETYQSATEKNKNLVQEAIDSCPVDAICWVQ